VTLEAAVASARWLNEQALLGWPDGYDATQVRERALACDRVFCFTATIQARARQLVEQLSVVEASW
jgi:hypothetical protein